MPSTCRVSGLTKTYQSGCTAWKNVDLDIHRGEIFALLGPNGAGKTTLISIICGISSPSQGSVLADGYDIVRDYLAARSKFGLVPQELCSDAFENVWSAVNFSSGLFGKPSNPEYIEKLLRQLSLWDKKDAQMRELSGGMKRRVMIAKALSHEPDILFLDEPTAGVDVELRKDMWEMVRQLQKQGVTIILTTHYIEEAEEMADRIGVIRKGKILLVEEKQALMDKLGSKELSIRLQEPVSEIPDALTEFSLQLDTDGDTLSYRYDSRQESDSIARLLRKLTDQGLEIRDLHSSESSLDQIVVSLVRVKEHKDESVCHLFNP